MTPVQRVTPASVQVSRTRVLFGAGSIERLREEVETLGLRRVLVIGRRHVQRVEEQLGGLAVARFDGAVMHTPTEVTERALALVRARDIDSVVAVGGGSDIGLAKALAHRARLAQVVLPTTYAGSEMTPVLGETSEGVKRTFTAETLRPDTVIYDVDLSLGLPMPMTVVSAINAMAHAVEALYADNLDPLSETLAIRAIEQIANAVPAVAADPADSAARTDLLQAAWFAGVCLGSTRMGLHHQLCHVLGGSYGLPHAETHAVLLPHVLAYTSTAVPEVARRIARALGVRDAAAGMYDLVAGAGGPTSLREIGFCRQEIPRAASFAAARPYPHPRQPGEADIEKLFRDAWSGLRPVIPGAAKGTDHSWLTEQVVSSFSQAADGRTRELLSGLVQALHGFVTTHDLAEHEWAQAIDFLTRTGQTCDDKRQEFVMLSDVLGVSSMVDLLANSRTPDATSSAVLGPFYIDGPPAQTHGADIADGLPGTPLWVDVLVTDTAGAPIEDAVVDVWQSNEDGFYDVQLPELDGPVLRGRFRTGADGRLKFWSILPCAYPIPDDGPVGKLLAAAGRHPYRPAHVHFLVQADGYQRLITQLFVRGGRYLDMEGGQGDVAFGAKSDLITDFAERTGPTPDGRVVEGSWRSLDFVFRISPETPDTDVQEAQDADPNHDG
ncbi:maleylacetate reductase and hydroxyquinol 1,2-dioxygenase domain-containing protein [Amycolatopsis japonica]